MQKIKRYRILITGVAGFIGSKLATELLNLGHEVTGVDVLKYDKSSINHLYSKKNFHFHKDDISNEKTIKKFIKKKDIIIPLAGLVGAPLCEKNKKEAVKINLNAIKLIIKNISAKQKIIYPTSNSGYGVGKKNAFCTEETPLNPISLYGRTKADAEKVVMQHKNSISFRLATVFGYSYRMRSDLLVNNFVKTALDKNKLEIFEPHFRRNYIHINDIVDAFVFSINNFEKLKSNTYNLGLSSANITKLELAKKIKKFYKKLNIKIILGIKDPDQRDYFVSNKKIEKKGFKAKVKLDEGIEELFKVFRNSDIKINNNY
jgi:nucleoside-diphosphate-sugar epimerase